VLLAILGAIGAKDFESLHKHFTSDIELNIHGFTPVDGSWRGAADAVLLHETGRLNADGGRYEVRGAIWYTFEGSQIKRIEEFLHTVWLA
jgi:hypothetical protein